MKNPTLNEAVVLARIAEKIEARVDRMGFIPAIGTREILLHGGRIVTKTAPKWVN